MSAPVGNSMITPQRNHDGDPMLHFMSDDQRLERLFSRPVTESQFSSNDSTMFATEDDRSTVYMSQSMTARHSLYSSSSMPSMTCDNMSSPSVSNVSTQYNLPMYNLPFDSSGEVYTYRSTGPIAVNRGPLGEGTFRCLFAFSGCTEFCRKDIWKDHVSSHLSDVTPPELCICPICEKSFESTPPEVNWSRFLNHILGHNYSGTIRPSQEFLEFCRDKDIISEFTTQRFDPSLATHEVPQVLYPYRGHDRGRDRERERNCTPRSFLNNPSLFPDVARVEYPATWGVGSSDSTRPRVSQGSVMVNRGNLRARGGGGHRA